MSINAWVFLCLGFIMVVTFILPAVLPAALDETPVSGMRKRGVRYD